MRDLGEILSKNSYPGRGIVFGKTEDEIHAVGAYFIMGRSENSRNRVFEADGAGVRATAFDEALVRDPSLVIYSPVRVLDDIMIVTNGDQTDTIYEFLKKGDSFAKALATRRFEPDSPIFTPRISGILNLADGSYKLSILKAVGEKNPECVRFFFEYNPAKGKEGHFIHTYRCDGNPPPSFDGEPISVGIPQDIDEMTDMLWNNLNPQNKVSLFVRYINLETKAFQTRIINKNKQV